MFKGKCFPAYWMARCMKQPADMKKLVVFNATHRETILIRKIMFDEFGIHSVY
jgi:hypothetical protein